MKVVLLVSLCGVLAASGAYADSEVVNRPNVAERFAALPADADEIVGLDANERVIARLGALRGIAEDGAAGGPLFPASLVLVGGKMFVANLPLPLTAAAGDESEEDVAIYTISEIDLDDDDRRGDD